MGRPTTQMKPMARFSYAPISLYRIQSNLPVKLRDYERQISLDRQSFDLKLHNGLVHPMPEGSPFYTPNGMSLRPASEKMIEILKAFRGSPSIYRLHEGLPLPKHFVILHEHTDHYSLQTTEQVTLELFNKRLTEFLQSLPPPQTKEKFLESLDDIDDQDS